MANTYIVIGLIVLLVVGLIFSAISDWNIWTTEYRLISRLFGKKVANLWFILPPLIVLLIAGLALIMLRINGYEF